MENLNFTTVTVIDSTGKQNILENIGDPNSIEWICIENTKYGFKFLLHKKEPNEVLNHPMSVERAKATHRDGRLGDRFEWISIYNAIHTAGLNDILKRVGGDTIKDEWYWTEEFDEFASNANYAWIFNGDAYGALSYNGRYYASTARVFRAFSKESF